jgi:hypothetical protein
MAGGDVRPGLPPWVDTVRCLPPAVTCFRIKSAEAVVLIVLACRVLVKPALREIGRPRLSRFLSLPL